MPEAPDLEVVREVLSRRVAGWRVASARVLRPIVLRSMAAPDLPADIVGRRIEEVTRRGKFLLLALSGGPMLVINPMLSGVLHLCSPAEKVLSRTCLILGLGDDLELRYMDPRDMGMVYYVAADQLHRVPRLEGQGPDVLNDQLAFEQFKARLRPYHGEIKGILTRGAFLAGIGNAYSDEILFAARISPFRKCKSLSDEELERLYNSARKVVAEALVVLRERMGEEIHKKIRDFLQVHNKGGQPCTRCGHVVSQLTANQRITSFCRHCQPGSLIRR